MKVISAFVTEARNFWARRLRKEAVRESLGKHHVGDGHHRWPARYRGTCGDEIFLLDTRHTVSSVKSCNIPAPKEGSYMYQDVHHTCKAIGEVFIVVFLSYLLTCHWRKVAVVATFEWIGVQPLEELTWPLSGSLIVQEFNQLPSSYFTQCTSVVQIDFFKRTESISGHHLKVSAKQANAKTEFQFKTASFLVRKNKFQKIESLLTSAHL